MKAVIWGSRGSLPATVNANIIRSKITKALEAVQGHDISAREAIDTFIDTQLPFAVRGGYGTNTTCVEIRSEQNDREFLVIDSGTGLRDFGGYLMKTGQTPAHIHILLTHPHWDHIQGFPFFVPAYIPGNRIDIYSFHSGVEAAFRGQQSKPYFPVPMEVMQADIQFHEIDVDDQIEIEGYNIRHMAQRHPGTSYGYRIEREDKTIVFSSDSEHKSDAYQDGYPFVDFFRDTDLLIFDAQYTLTESVHVKEDWGHSSNIMGVELAMRSGAKHLCMFHSEPTADDDQLEYIENSTKRYAHLHDESYALQISHAYDGMEIEV